jgi:hypothetical protein
MGGLRKLTPEFDGLYVTGAVLLKAEDVDHFLHEFLSVPPTQARHTELAPLRPVLHLVSMNLRPAEGEGREAELVRFEFGAYYLLLGEEASGAGAPEGKGG